MSGAPGAGVLQRVEHLRETVEVVDRLGRRRRRDLHVALGQPVRGDHQDRAGLPRSRPHCVSIRVNELSATMFIGTAVADEAAPARGPWRFPVWSIHGGFVLCRALHVRG
jgi:hypothetical protein